MSLNAHGGCQKSSLFMLLKKRIRFRDSIPRLSKSRQGLLCNLDADYFSKNGFESSPDAVVTVRITSPFRPTLGTVAVIVVAFFRVKLAA